MLEFMWKDPSVAWDRISAQINHQTVYENPEAEFAKMLQSKGQGFG